MKNLTLLAAITLLLFSCVSEPKDAKKANSKTDNSSEAKAKQPKLIVYKSENGGSIEYMKLIITENDERQWYYWTDKKEEEVRLKVSEIDGLEAVFFTENPRKVYEIAQSKNGFSLFLGDKRLQWYEQVKGVDSTNDPDVYTVIGEEDGYGGNIYIYTEDTDKEIPKFKELHVIPAYTESDGLFRGMLYISRYGLELDGPLSSFTGKVTAFYDKEKRHKAAVYTVHKGKPNGNVKIYSEKGNLYIEREYSNGDWVKSIESPVSANWSFNQAKAELTIRDLENGKRYAGGTTIIEIMLGLNNDYDIYKDILDKSTYENVFKINGKPFTGQLVGLNYTPAPDSVKSFELDFKNGKLHGDIKLFEEYFGLTLHEKFESGELTETVYVMNPEEMDGMAKPIIYFYPENTTELVVKLNIDGRLTHTYPKYEDEWKVTAHPDGTLFDENGKEYYALYWEGENDKPFTLNEGAVVKGENTVAFLEESLETLGLNRREANEFIMYWMPQMENNAYNLIHFSTAEYEEIAQLDIEPKPETIIRIMMVFQELDSPISIPEQDLQLIGKTRNGFTVVEWGGKKVNRTTIF